MPLILQPTFNETTREEYEAFLEEVRARRLTAALEYMQGRDQKLSKEADIAERRLHREYELLGKDLQRMEKLDETIQARMTKIEGYNQEIGFITTMKEQGILPAEDEDD